MKRIRKPESEAPSLSSPGTLFDKADGGDVRCTTCAHRCQIPPEGAGICGARRNEGGVLQVPFGWVSGLAVDPIEKKPFFHVLPGSRTASFGMLGCNFRCDFCQNWEISQATKGDPSPVRLQKLSAADVAAACREYGAPVVTSTYNEPFISAEWARAVFTEARKSGVRGAFVSNGYGTPEAIRFMRPVLDFMNIDLKSMDPATYRTTCGAELEPVLQAIETAVREGIWVEVVTLVVPGMNDSDGELKEAARFIASVSRDIPWHLTAFHGAYRMADAERTPPETLVRACETGRQAGLHFVYAGNLPGRLGGWENTVCPSCSTVLVEREGYKILSCRLKGSNCPGCGLKIPGVWG